MAKLKFTPYSEVIELNIVLKDILGDHYRLVKNKVTLTIEDIAYLQGVQSTLSKQFKTISDEGKVALAGVINLIKNIKQHKKVELYIE